MLCNLRYSKLDKSINLRDRLFIFRNVNLIDRVHNIMTEVIRQSRFITTPSRSWRAVPLDTASYSLIYIIPPLFKIDNL